MIFQQNNLLRYFLVLIIQPILSFVFFTLTYKLLKRKHNRFTINLSLFYILMGTGLLLNILYVIIVTFLKIELLLYFIYIILSFSILFAYIFLPLFIFQLIKPFFKLKNYLISIIIYGVLCGLLFLIPGGIIINEDTNWIPQYNIFLSLITILFFTSTILIPSILMIFKIYRSFEDKFLKKKFSYFFIGLICLIISFYGLVIYNTWHNSIFRLIWPPIFFFLTIPAAILLYLGVGKDI